MTVKSSAREHLISQPCGSKEHGTCNGFYQLEAKPFPLKMLCKCPCHLYDLYAEQERLTALQEQLMRPV